MSFKNAAIKVNSNLKTRTTNGMKARVSSASDLLDLFNCIGSSRGQDITSVFSRALMADEDKALRILLWSRDILEGAGERKQFRDLLVFLESYKPELATRLIPKIPELGRWDDLFVLQHGTNKTKAFNLLGEALMAGNALAAKWTPREKSSKRKIAYELRKHLKLSPKEYRKLLVNATDVVENKMCSGDWSDINFSHVPSIAAFRYQNAFKKNAPKAYNKYLDNLNSENPTENVKVNSKALYPHDIIMSILKGHDAVAYAQWDALPNFCGNNKILPLVDVSGSMGSFRSTYHLQPVHIAVALGLYLSDKNTSAFKDVFLTFTKDPKINVLQGNLKLKMAQLASSAWGYNTDLEKAFEAILNLAISENISEKDMPDYLLILSDMQFDQAVNHNQTAFKMIKQAYKDNGYKMPRLVFWNLAASTSNVAVKFTSKNAAMVSGFSPTIMKSILSDDLEQFTPENVMMQTIMSERYSV